MSNVKFKLNRAGVGQLLKSGEMQAVIASKANTVQNRAGDGFTAETYIGRDRVRAIIKAETYEAYQECLENNTLLKALR